ncbi:MAG: MalY/PatB family protein [Acidiferrobacter sp.]
MTDFDAVIDRRNTGSVKWDRYRDTEIIPLWVADMDFPAPPAVISALHERIQHGIFGYGNAPRDLLDVLIAHIANHHHWAVRPEWIVWLPGLVTGINLSCRAVGAPGDEVLTIIPVYPPFLSAPGLARRRLVTAPLTVDRDGLFVLDWTALEKAVTPMTRLLLLCNPHNPVGRVYTRVDLEKLGEFCERHDLMICADEIHAGLVLNEDVNHLSIASLAPELARRTITLLAPSKTFNIPGLGFSFAVIPDAALRTRFRSEMKGIVPDVNVLGYVAALAAYRDGAAWQKALIAYLRQNRDLVMSTLQSVPKLKTSPIEATYLAWIDARGLSVANPQRFFEKAGVGLSDGEDFGTPGFVRLNFGCRRALLEEALGRMVEAVAGR